jgi:hypothetical protein
LKTEGGFQWNIEKCEERGVFLFRRRTDKGIHWSIDEQKPGYRENSIHVP